MKYHISLFPKKMHRPILRHENVIKLCLGVFVLFVLTYVYTAEYVQTRLQRSLTNTIEDTCNFRESNIKTRLIKSEKVWEDWNKYKARVFEQQRSSEMYKKVMAAGKTHFWDWFVPTYNCPHLVQRIGDLGDGGKWVCGLSHLDESDQLMKESCIVYSFGVHVDVSFEEEILNRTKGCIVRMYDPTVEVTSKVVVDLQTKYPTRVHFSKIGISDKTEGTSKTLKSLLEENNEHFISMFKIDVEGSEFPSFNNILSDFPNGLPFGQLQVEFHLSSLGPPEETFTKLNVLWNSLENAGLRAFHSEPNLVATYYEHTGKTQCMEYSFINMKTDHALLHASC